MEMEDDNKRAIFQNGRSIVACLFVRFGGTDTRLHHTNTRFHNATYASSSNDNYYCFLAILSDGEMLTVNPNWSDR